MRFVANFTAFQLCKSFENRLRFDEVTESLKVGTFLGRQCIYVPKLNCQSHRVDDSTLGHIYLHVTQVHE